MNTLVQKALKLAEQGYTIIPLKGKIPVKSGWQKLRKTTPEMIYDWERDGSLQNLGMVCGVASNNTVVIDFDGVSGYELFKAAFPELVNTMTVATGSGNGMHVYYRVDLLPDSRAVMGILMDGGELVNVEFKSDGKQVVIPPSIHPDTGKEYTVVNRAPIMHVPDLAKVWAWAQSLKPQGWQPPTTYSQDKNLNRKLLAALESYFRSQPHKVHGDWINCSCPKSSAHEHGDRTFSFGFNTSDGGVNCYRCGSIMIKDICTYIGIDPAAYGGVYEKTEAPMNIRLAAPSVQYGNANAPAPADTGIPVVKRSERLTSYLDRLHDFDTPRANIPVPFPLKVLHRFEGMSKVGKPGKLIGIVGVSGGGKSSLLETMVDGWLTYHVPCLVWSPEWTADEFIERAVQRYGGPSMADLYMHEIFIDEYQRGIKNGVGVELSPEQLEAASKAIATLRGWKEEVGYLDFPFLTVGHLQASIEATLKSLDFKPRVLIIDYVQLMHAMETSADLTMYNLLIRIKALCNHYGLQGVIATQTTKSGARGQQNGELLDGLAARYVNDDAFNLFVTINPDRHPDTGSFMPSAVLNVAKNSYGQRGRIRVPADWARMTFGDYPHANQSFEGE